MRLYGVGGDVEFGGDLLVGAAGGERLEHLDFAAAYPQRRKRLGIAVERRRFRTPKRAHADEDTEPEESEGDQDEADIGRMGTGKPPVIEPLQRRRARREERAVY